MMMKMVFSIMILLMGSTMAIEAEETPAPAPGTVDCSTVIYDMLDCIPYLTVDSSMGKVDSSCCSGLESVVSVDSSCLCFGLKESVTLGINLNFTRALHLPSDCNLSVSPSVTHCSVSSLSSPSPSPSSPPPSHSHLSPKTSPLPSAPSNSPKAPSSSKPPVSAPKSPSSPSSSSSSPASSASPTKAPIIISQTSPVPAPAPTKSGASYISIISIFNLVLITISMINVVSLV